MKLAQHDNEFETNTEVKSQDFAIGDASKLIGILRNFLYQHKARTGVQEYMSNARDAMREAKSTKRIIVTVPNALNPVFKVRDFGPGITPQRMSKVFTQYGNSTKTSTNNQVGGFGIGAKSAWAYTDSFTIVSITGGRKRTYVAHTGVNNQGRMDLVTDEPTQEETGVEISYAVKSGDLGEFKNAILRACYFWTPAEYPEFKGITALDIPARKPSVRIGDLELVAVNDLPHFLGLDQRNTYDRNQCSIVIDGIPYKPSKEFIAKCSAVVDLVERTKCNVIMHIGNGVIDIPATRESVSDTDLNVDVLNKLAATLHVGLTKHIETEFKKAKTNAEWITCYKEMSKSLKVDEHSKRGDYRIKEDALYSENFKKLDMYEVGFNTNRRATGSNLKREDTSGIDLVYLNSVFFLDNIDEAIVTQNRRIAELCQKGTKKVILLKASAQYETINAILAKDGTITTPVTKTVVVSLKESEKILKKIVSDLGGLALSTLPFTMPLRVPRDKRDKEKEEFMIHEHSSYRKRLHPSTLEKVETNREKYLYVKYGDYANYVNEFQDMREFCDSLGWTLCALSPSSIRTVAGSKNFQTYDSWIKNFKTDDKIVAGICAEKAKNKEAMALLSDATTKIKDKALVEMLESYKPILRNGVREVPKKIQAMVSKEVKEFLDADDKLTKHIKDSYPLISRINGKGEVAANEIVVYINAKV